MATACSGGAATSGGERIASQLAIHEAHDAAWIGVGEFRRQCAAGKCLVANRTREALDGSGADARETLVTRGGVGPAVIHRGGNFHAGGEAIDDEAAGLALEDGEQVAGIGEIFRRGVDRRGELAFEMMGDAQQIGVAAGIDEQRIGSEDFLVQRGVLEEVFRIGGEDRRFALRAFRFGIGLAVGAPVAWLVQIAILVWLLVGIG